MPKYKDGEGNNCTRRIAFARRSVLTKEQLEERQRKGDLKKLQELAQKHSIAIGLSNPAGDDNESQKAKRIPAEITTQQEHPTPPKRGRGRPRGSRNKKTLEREAREAALADPAKEPEKRRRGRPPGSRNKKMLERLAKEAAGLSQNQQS